MSYRYERNMLRVVAHNIHAIGNLYSMLSFQKKYFYCNFPAATFALTVTKMWLCPIYC
jgi:hypothetical protein